MMDPQMETFGPEEDLSSKDEDRVADRHAQDVDEGIERYHEGQRNPGIDNEVEQDVPRSLAFPARYHAVEPLTIGSSPRTSWLPG